MRHHISQTLDSIVQQVLPEDWQIEILIGVDGCPATISAVKDYRNPYISVYEFLENCGTYSTFNALLPFAHGELLLRADSDDIMLPGRLFKMIQALQGKADIVGTFDATVDSNFKIIAQKHASSDGAQMFKRAVFETLGGFLEWPCGADSELLFRARVAGFKRLTIPESLLLRRRYSGQLTQKFNSNTVERKTAIANIQRDELNLRKNRYKVKYFTPPVRVPYQIL